MHPRARGEIEFWRRWSETLFGASPRARGNPTPRRQACERPRCIPTRAGKSRACRLGRRLAWVHPRTRGEIRTLPLAAMRPTGASPRAGKSVLDMAKPICTRCIPARAGKSSLGCQCQAVGAVHPRARGEICIDMRQVILALGASPRARGNLSDTAEYLALARSIPTNEGFTHCQVVRMAIRGTSPQTHGDTGLIAPALVVQEHPAYAGIRYLNAVSRSLTGILTHKSI